MEKFFAKANELKELTSNFEDTVDYIQHLIDLCQLEGKGTEEAKKAAQDAAKDEIPQLMIRIIVVADAIIEKLTDVQLTARQAEFDQNFDLV